MKVTQRRRELKITQERLRGIKADAMMVGQEMMKLALQIDQAAEDQISPGDVSLQGLYACEAFIRDNKHFLETMS